VPVVPRDRRSSALLPAVSASGSPRELSPPIGSRRGDQRQRATSALRSLGAAAVTTRLIGHGGVVMPRADGGARGGGIQQPLMKQVRVVTPDEEGGGAPLLSPVSDGGSGAGFPLEQLPRGGSLHRSGARERQPEPEPESAADMPRRSILGGAGYGAAQRSVPKTFSPRLKMTFTMTMELDEEQFDGGQEVCEFVDGTKRVLRGVLKDPKTPEKDIEHKFTSSTPMTRAADVRACIEREVQGALPKANAFRFIDAEYQLDSEQADLGWHSIDDLDDDVEELEKFFQTKHPLPLKVKVGFVSSLMTTDMAPNDEGKALFDDSTAGEDMYKLTVRVARGKDLRAMNRNGTSDPFVQCELCERVSTRDEEDTLQIADFLTANLAGAQNVAELGPEPEPGPPEEESFGQDGREHKDKSRPERRKIERMCRKQTKIIKRNNVNPLWDEDLSFDIPANCEKNREKLEGCELRVLCYSAAHVVGSPKVRRTSKSNMIGSTTISMLQVLEAIAESEERADNDDDDCTNGTWYQLKDKKRIPTRQKVMGRVRKLRMGRSGAEGDDMAETSDGEDQRDDEEENTGSLELSFCLLEPEASVEPEPIRAETTSQTQEPEPELEPEPEGSGDPEPEPELELEPESEDTYRDGKVGITVIKCEDILEVDKKRSKRKKNKAEFRVTMRMDGTTQEPFPSTEKVGRKEGGDRLSWECEFGNDQTCDFEICQKSDHVLVLQLRHETSERSRFIGEAKVPLRDLFHKTRLKYPQEALDGAMKSTHQVHLRVGQHDNVIDSILKLNADRWADEKRGLGRVTLKVDFRPDFQASVYSTATPNPDTSGPAYGMHRQTMQMGLLTPMKPSPSERRLRKRNTMEHGSPFFLSPRRPSTQEPAESEPKQPDGLMFTNTTVEVLMLGARELVSKPRKAEITCEYMFRAPDRSMHTKPLNHGFRLLERGHNPTFTASRADLERKSAAKLRKILKNCNRTVTPDCKKPELIHDILTVPHLKVDDVPFAQSPDTKLRIQMLEQPLMGRNKTPREFASAEIKLFNDDGVQQGDTAVDVDEDEDTDQKWSTACTLYIEGVQWLCRSNRQDDLHERVASHAIDHVRNIAKCSYIAGNF
jgi:hypothetical protein